MSIGRGPSDRRAHYTARRLQPEGTRQGFPFSLRLRARSPRRQHGQDVADIDEAGAVEILVATLVASGGEDRDEVLQR